MTGVPKQFERLFKHLEGTWFRHNETTLGHRFTQGYTDALVAPISLTKKPPQISSREGIQQVNDPEILEGEFVLKLGRRSKYENKTEGDHHEEARQWSTEFAKRHMLKLKKPPLTQGKDFALLYQIAGDRLHETESADMKDAGSLESCVSRVSRSLLSEWNAARHDGECRLAFDLIHEWSAYRLLSAGLHNIGRDLTGGKLIFQFCGMPLINPLRFRDTQAGKTNYPIRTIRGMLHNDLHLRNIMGPKKNSKNKFWIIDFAGASKGSLMYDHAYLEVSLLVNESGRFTDKQRLADLLNALNEELGSPTSTRVHQHDRCLLNCVQNLRSEVEKWTSESGNEGLKGPIDAQFKLARVSAGLNWANKPLKKVVDQEAAFIYAAWAGSQYIRDHVPAEWKNLMARGASIFYEPP